MQKTQPLRRIILATAVVETGLTIDTLKHIIDSGFHRSIETHPFGNIQGLLTKPEALSQAMQRFGRVGRKFPGDFYTLYPKDIFDRLNLNQFNELQTGDISSIMLQIIAEQLALKISNNQTPTFKISDIDLIDSVSIDNFHNAIDKLCSIGYLSPVSDFEYIDRNTLDKYIKNLPDYVGMETNSISKDSLFYQWIHFVKSQNANNNIYSLTRLGSIAANLYMLPEYSRIIFGAYQWGLSVFDACTIVAFMQADEKKLRLENIKWDLIYAESGLNALRGNFNPQILLADNFIDGLVLFYAARKIIIKSNGDLIPLYKFCELIGVSYDFIEEFITIRENIIEKVINAGLDVFYGKNMSFDKIETKDLMNFATRIKYILYESLKSNLAIWNGSKYVYRGLHFDYRGFAKKMPKYLLFKNLRLMPDSQVYIFNIICSFASSLDGWVNVDTNFTLTDN